MISRYLSGGVVLAAFAISQIAYAEDAASFDFQLSSRQGVSQDGTHALEEYRSQAGMNLAPSDAWRVKLKAEIFTERELDVKPYTGTQIDELFVNYLPDPCAVRAGIQQVVWGRADRLQVLDVIHPMDLRESYFGDWSRKRIPLAMLNTECVGESQSFQLLLISQVRYDLLPSAQGRFAVPSVTDKLSALNVPVRDAGKPNPDNPSAWSSGAQWSGRLGSTDVTANAFHGWQPNPVLRPDAMGYESEATRFTMWGGSLTQPIGPVVLHAESAWSQDITGYVQSAAGLPLPRKVNQWTYLLGVDYQFEPWFFSIQHYEQRMLSYEPLLSPKSQQILTLVVRRTMLQDRLHATGYIAQDIEQQATYGSISAYYEIDMHWIIRGEIELFTGSVDSFGRFSQQDRVVVGMDYNL